MARRTCGFVTFVAAAALLAPPAPAPAQQAPRHPSHDGVGVFNHVESRTTVTACPKADGARVARGDLVCELDPADLRDRLRTQEIVAMGAEAAYQNARLSREVAEIALTEYLEGVFKQELETISGEVALAMSDLKRAEDRVDWSKRMFARGFLSEAQLVADKLELQRATFAVEQAQTKKQVLTQYSKDVKIKDLKSQVEKARADELGKQAARDNELQKRSWLNVQIKACQVVAPEAGTVRYALEVEPGAVVHDGQLLFRIAPDAPAAPPQAR